MYTSIALARLAAAALTSTLCSTSALGSAPVQRPQVQRPAHETPARAPAPARPQQPAQIQAPSSSPDPEPLDGNYQAALIQLEDASLSASDRADELTLAGLASAIEALEPRASSLARDPKGRALLAKARMNLARGYLRLDGDPTRANRVIDQAIARTHAGLQAAADSFGPLGEHVAERRALAEQAPRFPVELVCEVACEVSIDGYPMAEGTHQLLAGAHQIYLRSLDERVADREQLLELGPEHPPEQLALVEPPPPIEPPAPVPEPVLPVIDYVNLPRFAPRLPPAMIGIGATLSGAGLIWVAAATPTNLPAGYEDHRAAGATMAAIGATTMLIWIPLLVAEKRRRARLDGASASSSAPRPGQGDL